RKLSITSENDLKSLRKQLEESQQRYATMHLSVEENFNNLRLRLADEDAHLCPLCGQPKEWHNSKEGLHHTFSKILSPLEEETNKLKEKCELAEANHLDFVKKSNQTAGMLETQ
ncbi:MAG: hypothetical protein K2J87_01805, partial [Muribaculaceae bacterium]|nr:hypothetical protein [Muribaculaceae bacterium]